MDPRVEFNGPVNPDTTDIYSLLVAAVWRGIVDNTISETIPVINFNGPVGNLRPFYSTNFQTLQLTDINGGTKSVAGVITVKEAVQTTAEQNYSTDKMNVSGGASGSMTFTSTRGGQINYDVSRVNGQFNVVGDGSTRVIIDGNTNFTGTGVGLSGVSRPLIERREAQLAAQRAAAASGGNLQTALKISNILSLNEIPSARGGVTVVMDDSVKPSQGAGSATSSVAGGEQPTTRPPVDDALCAEEPLAVACR